MKRYNHAMTIAYEVISTDPSMPSLEEQLDALRKRVHQLETDPEEAQDALRGELPFDTYEMEEDDNGN